MPSLKGRVAIVTGASRGIGRAIALGLARAGCDVVVAAKSTESTEKLPGSIHTVAAEVEALGGRALPVQIDVRDADQIEAMAARRSSGSAGSTCWSTTPAPCTGPACSTRRRSGSTWSWASTPGRRSSAAGPSCRP